MAGETADGKAGARQGKDAPPAPEIGAAGPRSEPERPSPEEGGSEPDDDTDSSDEDGSETDAADAQGLEEDDSDAQQSDLSGRRGEASPDPSAPASTRGHKRRRRSPSDAGKRSSASDRSAQQQQEKQQQTLNEISLLKEQNTRLETYMAKLEGQICKLKAQTQQEK